MKRFNNTRGHADTYVVVSKWSYYILAIIIFTFSIILFVGKGVGFLESQAAVSEDLPSDILISRLVNTCLAYEEEGRVYQNLIDYETFTETHVESCTGQSVYLTLRSYDDAFPELRVRVGRTTPEKSYTKHTLVRIQGVTYPALLEVRT